MAGYELRTLVIEPKRNTYEYLVERFGDRPASRYQEGSYNVQSTSNFHYRPTWDADREVYDPNYTALKLTDPYAYKDPRQYYYTPYVANAAARFESFAQTLKYVEDRRLLDKMPENWHTFLTGFVLPLRHFESAAQLISSNASRFAWGSTVAQPAAFASFDRIGNAQLLSLIGLAMAGGAADTLTEAKKNWLYSAELQGLRKFVEQLFVEPDWAVSLIALDLADVQLYPMLYTHTDERALAHGATAYSLFARHFTDWFVNERKWLTALLKAWSEDPQHGESNRKVLNDIVDRWYPQACAAVRLFAEGVAQAAGSTTLIAAADRAAAEAAGELSKYGIQAPAQQGSELVTAVPKTRQVGVDLQDSEDSHSLVEAIEADNPGVGVAHMPGLVRITTVGELVIRRDSVQERLGRDWETHEFQLNIVSYFGNIAEWDDDKIVIKWEH